MQRNRCKHSRFHYVSCFGARSPHEWLLGNSNNFFPISWRASLSLFSASRSIRMQAQSPIWIRVNKLFGRCLSEYRFFLCFFRITSNEKKQRWTVHLPSWTECSVKIFKLYEWEIATSSHETTSSFKLYMPIFFRRLHSSVDFFSFRQMRKSKHVNEFDDAKSINKCEILLNCAQLR